MSGKRFDHFSALLFLTQSVVTSKWLYKCAITILLRVMIRWKAFSPLCSCRFWTAAAAVVSQRQSIKLYIPWPWYSVHTYTAWPWSFYISFSFIFFYYFWGAIPTTFFYRSNDRCPLFVDRLSPNHRMWIACMHCKWRNQSFLRQNRTNK